MEEIRQDTEIQLVSKEVEPLQTKINNLIVKDEASSKFGTDLASFILKMKNRLEARRKFFVQPLNDHVKTINGEFKNLIEPLDKMEGQIKSKLLDYRKIIREEAGKKQTALNKMAEENGLPLIEKPLVDNAIKSGLGSSFAVKRWVFKVLDETKIPREYFALDEMKIRAEIRDHTKTIKGVSQCDLKIEGIKIYQEESISIKT